RVERLVGVGLAGQVRVGGHLPARDVDGLEARLHHLHRLPSSHGPEGENGGPIGQQRPQTFGAETGDRVLDREGAAEADHLLPPVGTADAPPPRVGAPGSFQAFRFVADAVVERGGHGSPSTVEDRSRERASPRGMSRGGGGRVAGRPGPAPSAPGTPTGGTVRKLNRRSNTWRSLPRDPARVKPPGWTPGQGTILEIGSSRMSVAPWALSRGMSRLTCVLSTTVSTAYPPSESSDTVGDFMAGRTSRTWASRSPPTFSLISTRPSARRAPRSRVVTSCIARRLSGSATASRFATSTGSEVIRVS